MLEDRRHFLDYKKVPSDHQDWIIVSFINLIPILYHPATALEASIPYQSTLHHIFVKTLHHHFQVKMRPTLS
ncbi:hypothetical protein XA68_14967 [Ophiocordyceps unilateralis]|uniref:Uncharacterized protein n=1 Tax=Ophiocordyceps unilateralis TaxID=268505 RepID=A0A2A9PL86_OPHUN|nr:hypothetical protein XA68_14967 [Ophiocordyceps unilateralis]